MVPMTLNISSIVVNILFRRLKRSVASLFLQKLVQLNDCFQVRYSSTQLPGSLAVGNSLDSFSFAEVLPTPLRTDPTYVKVFLFFASL